MDLQSYQEHGTPLSTLDRELVHYVFTQNLLLVMMMMMMTTRTMI